MATNTLGGEWCGPTRQLKNSQLLALQHKSRNIVTGELRVEVEVVREEEVVLLVNKPPESAAVIGAKVDALPEAVVLDAAELFDDVICDVEPVIELAMPRTRTASASGSAYPMHRDTYGPLRMLLLLVVIAAVGVGALMFVV